jgi:starch synthase (maltosyl-transferring)
MVRVRADVFADGTAGVRANVRWRPEKERGWSQVPMRPVGNDRWEGEFRVSEPGPYRYEVQGWVDPYLTWRTMLERRVASATVSPVDLREGADVLRGLGGSIRGPVGTRLRAHGDRLEETVRAPMTEALQVAMDPDVEAILSVSPGAQPVGRSATSYPIWVDPPSAQSSAWYELFPRSTGPSPHRAGTLRDVRARLEYIADLGFDVVYLTPIHPIGTSNRRGPNNTLPAPPGSPGSPWAIGSSKGGHDAIHPELGDAEEYRELVREAKARGLEVAFDLAFQCSPDHPWVHEHPSWFHHLPDGTIRAAENPPKKYDDIFPIDFETDDWKALWAELLRVVEHWVEEGVRWFRVDNPHTKPFEFWKWLIGEVRQKHPDVMFLAEAFTRPKVMYRLAQAGFTHSYTYFAWRTRRQELTEYFRELTATEVAEYFRPHLWPNTPDILTEQFHRGQKSVFLQRLVLAGTLSSHYGIYGPAYELMEHLPVTPGSEEYRDSEKYQVRYWDLGSPTSLGPEIRRLNRIRRAHPALRTARRLTFHGVDNDRLLAYSRPSEDGSEVLLMVVNLDPEFVQTGWTDLDLGELGLAGDQPFDVHDLWTGARYRWHGRRNFVRLDPATFPAHILVVERPGMVRGRGGA